jgi:hypothetical protein
MGKTNPELRRRLEGLVKAINEEMQAGAREYALGAVSDLIDERDALYRKQDELEVEVERLRAAIEKVERLAQSVIDKYDGEVEAPYDIYVLRDILRQALKGGGE